MLLLCYPKCSTCKKAQAWLDSHGISYEYRDTLPRKSCVNGTAKAGCL